jgi:hypothetical protein
VTLAFDAVGPSSAGAGATSASPSWSHVITGTNNLLLAAVVCDTDATTITAITYGGTAMTPLVAGAGNYIHANNAGAGWVAVYKLVNAPAGTATVAVTLSASSVWEGGSLSFSGADTVTGIGTPQNAEGTSLSQPTMSFTPTTSGRLIAAFLGCGNQINSATSPLTSRWIKNQGGSNAGGMSGGATAPSTGSAVTLTWSITADFWGIMAAEVLAAGSVANAPAGLAAGSGVAQSPLTSPYSLLSGPNHAATATDLGGNYGSWATPQYAEGGP